MSWMGKRGIETQPIGWKPDVGQHGKFHLRLCEKTRSVRLTKQIIATKAAEAVGMLQAANDIELLPLDQLRATIGRSILQGILATMPKMTTPGMVVRFDKAKSIAAELPSKYLTSRRFYFCCLPTSMVPAASRGPATHTILVLGRRARRCSNLVTSFVVSMLFALHQ